MQAKNDDQRESNLAVLALGQRIARLSSLARVGALNAFVAFTDCSILTLHMDGRLRRVALTAKR